MPVRSNRHEYLVFNDPSLLRRIVFFGLIGVFNENAEIHYGEKMGEFDK